MTGKEDTTHLTGAQRLKRPKSAALDVAGGLLRIVLTFVRLPILALLVILEPFVCGALWLFATFGVLGCFFYRFLVHNPHFPFWGGLTLSLGAALAAAIYHGLIRLAGGSEE